MSLDVGLYYEVEPNKKSYVFEANITHNLGKMADKAGIYYYLWRPDEANITQAKELIEPIEKGLQDMKNRQEYYEQFNSPNGYGLYKHFVPFVEEYLNVCKEYPNAKIYISR